jgi:hypothetical protein
VGVLEEENDDFAARLRQHGEEVRHKSHIHLALPPPLLAPAPGNAA